MKTIFLLLACCATATGGAPADVALAYEMQHAVLPFPDLQKAEALLKDGFDPATPIGCGTFDSLDAAVTTMNADTAELLLRYRAKPKPATMVQAAFVASHDSALQMVRAFLKTGCPVNSTDGTGTALHKAVWRRNVELVSLLLAQKDIALDGLDIDDRTPLMIAVEKGDRRLVEMLLKAGADPATKNSKGLTAADLSEAAIEEQRRLQSLLQTRAQAGKPGHTFHNGTATAPNP